MTADAFEEWADARKRAADAKRDAKRDLTAECADVDHHELCRWADDGGPHHD